MDVHAVINPASLFSAKGLSVVITGGGSGIGLAVASALLQNEASKIYLIGRRKNVLDDAIKSLVDSPIAPKNASSVLVAISADVTDTESVAAVVEQIKNDTGYVDVLINNAGVIGPKMNTELHGAQSIEQLQKAMLSGYDQWGSTMAINTQSVIGVSAAFLPLLEAANTRRGFKTGKVQGKGIAREQDKSQLEKLGLDADDDRLAHIITVASVASYMRWCSAGLAYNASKSAAAHLGKMMSTFLAEWGIRSNIVCPGPYPSEMNAVVTKPFSTSEVPQGRMGNVNDIAAVFLFLVGKSGTYVNGTSQLTDGGRIAVFPSVY